MENKPYTVCTDYLNPLFGKPYEKVITLIIDYPLWLHYEKNQTLDMCSFVLSKNLSCIEYVDEKFYFDLGIKHLTTFEFEFDKRKLFYYRNMYHTAGKLPMTAAQALTHYTAYSDEQISNQVNKWFRAEMIRSTQYRNAIIKNETSITA